METVEARALPRVGLLGNPSDIYGGRVLAFTFEDFAARVRVSDGEGVELAGETREGVRVAGPGELALRDYAGGARLLGAALLTFLEHARAAADDPRARLRLVFESDVPRQAGLGGSSAIVVATLRALARRFEVTLAPLDLAELALAAEVERLGSVAGPQDRVAQALEGLVHMDFGGTPADEPYVRLDPGLLPPLLVAWDPRPGRPSSDVHGDVLARWEAGDPALRQTISRLPELVDLGVEALARDDRAQLRRLMDANFDLRASVFPVADRDREMVELGRKRGAGVKLAGSGGAVVALPEEGEHLPQLERAYAAAGFRTLRPRVTPG